jgi:hypothetical protein
MKGIRHLCTAVAVLALAAALVAPVAAAASRTDRALAQERYYSSYHASAAAQPRAVAGESDGAGAWKAVAIGAGALVLVLGTAELVTLMRLRALRAT